MARSSHGCLLIQGLQRLAAQKGAPLDSIVSSVSCDRTDPFQAATTLETMDTEEVAIMFQESPTEKTLTSEMVEELMHEALVSLDRALAGRSPAGASPSLSGIQGPFTN